DRSASRTCSRRRSTKPTTNAPTVPTAEKTFAASPREKLAKVWRPAVGEVVVDAQLHGAVHLEARNLAGRYPADLQRLAAGGERAADRACGEHDGELLACLAVAGVEDDVSRVGVDADQAHYFDLDAGLLACLPDRSVDQGLAEVHTSAGYCPVVVVGPADEQ